MYKLSHAASSIILDGGTVTSVGTGATGAAAWYDQLSTFSCRSPVWLCPKVTFKATPFKNKYKDFLS
jgi:hypothetical protein